MKGLSIVDMVRIKMHSTHILIGILLMATSVERVVGGCRMQERNPCETVCQWNAERRDYDCVLRAVVILPKTDDVEASLPRVLFYYINFMFTNKYLYLLVFFLFVCDR